MKESKVKYEEIKVICEKLVASGKKPTTSTIRQILGFGSFSTITDHLSKWKKTLPAIELSTDDIDDEIKLALKNVVENRVAKSLNELHNKIIELADERDAVLAEHSQSEILISELIAENEGLRIKLKITEEKLSSNVNFEDLIKRLIAEKDSKAAQLQR